MFMPEKVIEEREATVRIVGDKLEGLLSKGDPLTIMHIKEILQYCCDIIAHIDEDFDPIIVHMILLTCSEIVSSNEEAWEEYTREHAPLANLEALKQITVNRGGSA